MTETEGRPAPEEKKITLLPCPCGSAPGILRLEVARGSKIGTARGSCCGDWAVDFLTNTDNQEVLMTKAAAAWNAAQRAT